MRGYNKQSDKFSVYLIPFFYYSRSFATTLAPHYANFPGTYGNPALNPPSTAHA
jgi:hypothetical protein